MANWIREGERKEEVAYDLVFSRVSDPGSGWSFVCDEHGNPLDVAPDHQARLLRIEALRNDPAYVEVGVREYRWSFWDPGAIRCDCGAVVVMHSAMTNTCDGCGADYNGSGQRLAPRHLWGEETNETAGEIMGGHYDY